jgi:alpha-glucoside transport system permease protein
VTRPGRTSSAGRRAGTPWSLSLVRRAPLHSTVVGLSLLWLVPTVGVFVNSLRPAGAVSSTGWWTALRPPFQFTLDNYGAVLGTYQLGRGFLNSVAISVPATIIPVAIAALAGYALAWMRFGGRHYLLLAIVASLVVPLQATLVPVFQLLARWGLVGSFAAAWLAHTGYGLPFAIYLLWSFMAALPLEIMESAAIDGATPLVAFARIAVPLAAPALASLTIFQFLWVWNDLLVALIYVGGRPDVAPLSVMVSNLANSLGQDWQLLTAGAFVSMAVPLVVFFSLQTYLVRGILAGSLKG